MQPAWHGLKYVRPLLPQTGSTSVVWHSQPKLQAAVRFTWNGSARELGQTIIALFRFTLKMYSYIEFKPFLIERVVVMKLTIEFDKSKTNVC